MGDELLVDVFVGLCAYVSALLDRARTDGGFGAELDGGFLTSFLGSDLCGFFGSAGRHQCGGFLGREPCGSKCGCTTACQQRRDDLWELFSNERPEQHRVFDCFLDGRAEGGQLPVFLGFRHLDITLRLTCFEPFGLMFLGPLLKPCANFLQSGCREVFVLDITGQQPIHLPWLFNGIT